MLHKMRAGLVSSRLRPAGLSGRPIFVFARQWRIACRVGTKLALWVATAALCSGHLLYAAPAATTTVLQLSSGAAIGSGVQVTLTATVTGGGGPVSPGFVTFCDASAKYCEDLAVLGTATVNSSGVATMKKVLLPGTHRISASFNTTQANAGSMSAVQAVAVRVPSLAKSVPVPIITKTRASNPLPLQASVSVVGKVPFNGTLSIVQDQGRQTLATLPVGPSTAQFGFGPLAIYPYFGFTFGGNAVAGDFDGDGLNDLAAPGNYGFGEAVYGEAAIFLNDPAHPGHLLAGQVLSLGQTSSMLTGDFNNDGMLDLVVASETYGGASVLLLGDPLHPGQFLGGNDAILIPSSTIFQVAADLNQDGVLDLIGTDYASNVHVLFGDPAHPGQFINETTFPGGSGSVLVADLNGDGVLDLVAMNDNPAAYGIAVFMGDADNPGHFLTPVDVPLTVNVYPSQIVIGDFNQDGHPDLAVLTPHSYATTSQAASQVDVLFNNPNSPGEFLPAVGRPVYNSYGLAIGDFNGDGALDLAQLDSSSPGVLVFRGSPDGSGHFLPVQSYPESIPAKLSNSGDDLGFSSVAGVDLDGDGLSDLVLSLTGDGDYYPVNILPGQETQTASVSFPSVTFDATKSPLAQALYSGDENYSIIGSCSIDLTGSVGKPVLYDIHADVNTTDATVLWYWSGAVGAIDYGTTPALGSTTDWKSALPSQRNGPSYIKLTGLSAATKYYYRIRAIGYFSGCSHWTTTSPVESFTTTP